MGHERKLARIGREKRKPLRLLYRELSITNETKVLIKNEKRLIGQIGRRPSQKVGPKEQKEGRGRGATNWRIKKVRRPHCRIPYLRTTPSIICCRRTTLPAKLARERKGEGK